MHTHYTLYLASFFILCAPPVIAKDPALPCADKAITKLKPTGCLARNILYTEEGLSKNGQHIIAADEHVREHHFLKTVEGKMISLGTFAQASVSGLMPCIFDQLGYDKRLIGNIQTYSAEHFGLHSLALEGNKVVGTLRADYPFTGELKTTDGKSCRGNFDYADGIYSWKEARNICEAQFVKDEGKKVKPYLRQMRHYYHVAGIYYLCEMEDANTPKSDDKTTNYYRIDFEKESKPGTVLMRKATYVQQAKWKFK